MSEESKEAVSPRAEERKVALLLKKNEQNIGPHNLIEVGDVGYVIELDNYRPMAGNDWILFDYDDTLAAYTETKIIRESLFGQFLRNKGVQIDENGIQRALTLTDDFARWEELGVPSTSYHHSAHLTAISWVTDQLIAKKAQPEGVLDDVEKKLSKIREGEAQEEVPFYIDQSTKRLVLRRKTPWSKELEAIFAETTLKPISYPEPIEAVKLATSPNSIHRLNIGIFSYGEPYFQLAKIIKFLNESQDLPINQIWLTKVPKGKFIEELVKLKVNRKMKLEYPSAELSETEGEEIAFPSGYPLGETPHSIVIFDDSPKELSTLTKTSETLSNQTKATIVSVRSRKSGTREEQTEWEIESPYGEVDFRLKNVSSKELLKVFEINTYLAMKKNLGQDNPKVIEARQRLMSLGVTEPELAEIWMR